MKKRIVLAGVRLASVLATVLASVLATAEAQVPPVAAADQQAMLKSDDPKLARNKQFVFDFWRIVYEGGHLDQATKYMAEGYIQHNPNVPSGRKAFVELFSKQRKPLPVGPRARMPIIAIVAERDTVMVSTVRKVRDRQKADHVYYITWFDVFRIDEQGLIAEHWDPSEMWVEGKPPGAEFFDEIFR